MSNGLFKRLGEIADGGIAKAKGVFDTVREAANDPKKLNDLGDKVGKAVLGGIAAGADAVSAAAKDPEGTIEAAKAEIKKTGEDLGLISKKPPGPGEGGPPVA